MRKADLAHVMRGLVGLAGLAAVLLLGTVPAAPAATVTVTSAADAGTGSLRAAVADAEAGDTIAFDASPDRIELTSGAIAIDKSLTIVGPGTEQLTIDADQNSQIFTVTAGSLSISGLTLADGAATGGSFVTGGAIDYVASGALEISDCAFTGNTAGGAGGADTNSGSGWGGAVHVGFSASSLTVSGCSFTANRAGGDGGAGTGSGRGRGGAIDYRGSGALTVQESDFIANSAGGAGGGGTDSGTGRGGAINVSSSADNVAVSVSDSAFTANIAGGDGGAGGLSGQGWGGAVNDEAGSSVTVSGSTFDANAVGGQPGGLVGGGRGGGGAIRASGGGTILLLESTFGGNSVGPAGGTAGAVSTINKALSVEASTFVGNSIGGDGSGGAISASEFGLDIAARISNSTLVDNVAGSGTPSDRGGAIDVANMFALILESSTISGNSVGDGGHGAGISATGGPSVNGARVTARATIVSGNTGAANCDTPVFSSTYSLEGPSAGGASCGFHHLPSADPLLEALADNGGWTETMALPPGSPAADAVPAAHCPTSVDQRGEPRPDNGKAVCDVGAYELQDPPVAPPDPPDPPIDPPACPAAPLSVAPCPEDPPRDQRNKPSPRLLTLSLSAERKSLGQLLRSGRFLVTARVDRAVRLALTGRLRVRTDAAPSRTRLVPVFRPKRIRSAGPAARRVALALTRHGRALLRDRRTARIVVVASASPAEGRTGRTRAALTLLR